MNQSKIKVLNSQSCEFLYLDINIPIHTYPKVPES